MRGEHTIHIDAARCVGCGLCLKDCPANHIRVRDGKAGIRWMESPRL